MQRITTKESGEGFIVKISSRQPFAAAILLILAYGSFEATRQNEYTTGVQFSLYTVSVISAYLGIFLALRSRKMKIDLISRTISFYAIRPWGFLRFSGSISDVDCIKLHSKRLINGVHHGFMTISHMSVIAVGRRSYDFYYNGKIKKNRDFGSRVASRLKCKLIDEMEKGEGVVGKDISPNTSH